MKCVNDGGVIMINEGFTNAFEYKVIYVMRINDEARKGLLKIGDATVHTNKGLGELAPNCKELNDAARKRIDSYAGTSGDAYELLYTELAVRTIQKGRNLSVVSFRDHDVHEVLENSGFKHHIFPSAKGKEWYPVNLQTAKTAIEAVKNGRKSIKAKAYASGVNPIIFRPEQRLAIDRTIRQFKHGNKMLWNAKMRFGKTVCALQVIKEEGFHKTIIFTHRPDVEDGWFEDFTKIFYESGDYIFTSKKKGGNISQLDASGKRYIYFASIQDLRGSKEVGGKFDKNDEVFNTKWDLAIIDEAHEGTTTELGIDTIRAILKGNAHTKFLALSGTPFNIVTNFKEDELYTWDYIDEQKAKHNWDLEHFGDSNPYEELPEMKIYTYDLGQLITGKGYVSVEDKAFNFREFFRVWTGNLDVDYEKMPASAKIGEFVHEKML